MIGNIPNLLPRFLAIVLFGASCALLAEELELEVITLKYRTAQDVLPIVQPFVNQRGGTVSGMRNQLIVRTTPANLAEVRQILAGIDTLPRRLMQQNSEIASRDSEHNVAQRNIYIKVEEIR